jgi:hypothetical protein
MAINLADNNPRISYAVAAGATQTSFVVPFEFFDNEDLNVYVDTVLKTLTTDYTVTGGDGSTGTVSISVTGISGGSTVVITRSIDLERTTDFPVSGAFNISSLNTELDRLIAIASDIEDQVSRSIRLSDYDDDTSFVLDLPDTATRAGKYLYFNALDGAPEVASIGAIGAITIPVPITQGGTGATSLAQARTNLGTTDEALALAIALG